MRYMFGHTWEIPGGQWEKFECELDQDDLLKLIEELNTGATVESEAICISCLPLSIRHLMLVQKGKMIEAMEKAARGYISPTDKDVIVSTATQALMKLKALALASQQTHA